MFEELEQTGLCRSRPSRIVGWNTRLNQLDPVNTWFRHRRLTGIRHNEKVLDRCTIEPMKCLQEDDLFGVESNANLPDPNPEPPIYAMRFCPVPGFESILGLANEDGKVGLQNIHSKEAVAGPLPGWAAHLNAVFDFSWCTVDAHKMVTVSGDQSARLFNINYDQGFKATLETSFQGYTRSVKCCEWRPLSQHEFATGDRANTIHIWDSRSAKSGETNKPENFIKNAHKDSGESQVSVTGLLWLDSNILASVSGNDGTVKMWDLRKHYSLYKKKPIPVDQIQYPGSSFTQGYTSIERSENSPYFFVSCQDNNIYQYNALAINNRPVNTYTGAKISSFFIKSSVSHCGNYLASGSSNNLLHIWNTGSSHGAPVATLGPQEETINCVTWNNKENILASCTDDMRHRIWRPSFCNEVDKVKGWATMLQPPTIPSVSNITLKQPPSTPTSSGLRRIPQTPDQTDARRLFTPDSRGRRRPGASGHTPSIKAFLTPKNSALHTPTRGHKTPTNAVSIELNTTPTSAKSGQKRKLDLDENVARNKILKLDSEVKESLTNLINTNTSNVRISPKTFEGSPVKKVVTPRKFQSPLKNLFHSAAQSDLFAGRDSVRRPLTEIFSPTANLPSSVRDGTSPRHCCRQLHSAGGHGHGHAAVTPPRAQKSNWLRQLTEEKKKIETSKTKDESKKTKDESKKTKDESKKTKVESSKAKVGSTKKTNIKEETEKLKVQKRKSNRKLVLKKKP